jgi:hypothetical protein
MNYREWLDYQHDMLRKQNMSIEDIIYYRLAELGLPTEEGDLDYYDIRLVLIFAGNLNII